MGAIRQPAPVLLFVAVFSRYEEAFARAQERAVRQFGPIWKVSPAYQVDTYTDYYQKEMGVSLAKSFWAFENLIDPGRLPEIKRLTNGWEEEIAKEMASTSAVERPVNLDPGYVDLGKFVLASTKDHGHRIYLSDGIFAEITLSYSQKKWQALPWSYADYQNEQNQAFLTQCRDYLHQKRREMSSLPK